MQRVDPLLQQMTNFMIFLDFQGKYSFHLNKLVQEQNLFVLSIGFVEVMEAHDACLSLPCLHLG